MNCGKCGQPLTKAKEKFVLAGGPCLCASCTKEWSKKTSCDGPVKDLPLDVNGVSFFPEVDQDKKKLTEAELRVLRRDILEYDIPRICDEYCVFRFHARREDDEEDLKQCGKCPLNRIVDFVEGCENV